MKGRNKEGFAPTLTLVVTSILVVIIVLGITKIIQRTNNQNQRKQDSSAYHQSPLGFSFKKPDSGELREYSYDIDELRGLSDDDLTWPPSSETTETSVGTTIETDAYLLVATRMEFVGALPNDLISKMAYAGGAFFDFLIADLWWFNQVQEYMRNESDPTGFNKNTGQYLRWDTTYFELPNSQISGITYYGSFDVVEANRTVKKEYYLVDQSDKFIFYISSILDCAVKEQLEDQYREYSPDGSYRIKDTFDWEEYRSALYSISKECEDTSKNKAGLDLLLNSLEVE